MGLFNIVSDVLGMTNDYKSNVKGPDKANFVIPGQATNKDTLARYLSQTDKRKAPTMTGQTAAGANIDGSQQAQFREGQQTLASQLAQSAAGNGPSAAQQQLGLGLQQQLAMQRSAAASAGQDANPYLVQRQIADQAAQSGQALNAQMAVQRAQEAQAAQASLGNLLAQGRNDDIGLANQQAALAQNNQQFNAGQLQSAGAQNLSAYLANQAQADAQRQFYVSQNIGLDQAQAQSMQNYQNAITGVQSTNNQINAGVAASNTAAISGLAGAALGATGAGIAAKIKAGS